MEIDLMIKLNIKPSSNYTNEMWIMDIPSYESTTHEDVYLMQYNLRSKEDLRPKDLWFVVDYNSYAYTIISNEFLINNPNWLEYLTETIK